MISFTSHYLLSALPLTASTGFAEVLPMIDTGKTPGGCYCIKKYRGILTLPVAVLTSVSGSVFLDHLKDGTDGLQNGAESVSRTDIYGALNGQTPDTTQAEN